MWFWETKMQSYWGSLFSFFVFYSDVEILWLRWLGLGWVKGILHPKMKILSSFTHSQIVTNMYEFLSSAEHIGRYFEERLEPNSCLVPLTSIVEKNTMEVNGTKVPIILQNIFLCVQQKKETLSSWQQLQRE